MEILVIGFDIHRRIVGARVFGIFDSVHQITLDQHGVF